MFLNSTTLAKLLYLYQHQFPHLSNAKSITSSRIWGFKAVSSVAQSCPTLCSPMDCSMPGFPVHHQLPELTQTHVHLVMPSSHLILCRPLLLLPSIFPSIKVFSNESVLHIRWPKYWFQLQHQSFQWTFRTDFLYDWLVRSPCSPRDSQESSPTLQFQSINSSALSFLYSPTLTSIHDYWKNYSFD